MARSQKSDDQYSDEETKQRMVAALKGARLAWACADEGEGKA
jgi:hypothetical protein